MRGFYRGVVLIPCSLAGKVGVGYHLFFSRTSTDLVGHHLYIGKNRWLLPSGAMTKGQTFHRKMIHEYALGWWKIA